MYSKKEKLIMTTKCSGCGRNITDNELITSDFVLCKYDSKFTPKNNVKGGYFNKMAKKLVTKKSTRTLKNVKVLEMIKGKKSNEEILKKTGISKPYLYKLRNR